MGLFGPLGRLLGPLESFLGASWGILAASWRPLGVSWRPLEASWGDLGSSWGEIGVVLGDFWSTLLFLIIFWNDFGSKKGAQREAFWEAKRSKNQSKSRGTNLRAEKPPLGVILGRFRLDFQAVLGSKILIFHWFLKGFVNIHVFDKDECPRAI